MYKVVFLRHGESEWNLENRFTGWTDVNLSENGIKEALEAGKLLSKEGYVFDLAYNSLLTRAIKTLNIILEEMNLSWIPVKKTWRLNERHYGALQGLNKVETVEKHGEAQVKIWRRSYDIAPPELSLKDHRHPYHDPRYKEFAQDMLPSTECLKDTVARVLPYWHDEIVPKVKSGKKVIVVAHGNSIRALIKYLDNLSEEDIVEYNVPTGIPLLYELDKDMKAIKKNYLGDPEAIKAKIEAVKNQTKKH